ncbi:acyltransferase [Georgenia sp. 311]|uniref:acyltransferase family protein n=1 Tax=Georgenia sp. 311 TaxID=2585134 RepID=UPI001111EE5E|nr:acyltransferase family protein [Georgenia sp. 311]TNC20442.1 acyltransferase [Georgenia sp. 311]
MTAATTSVAAPSRSARPRFRADIQGLRAVAVLLVLAYHAGVPLVPGGYVGVDVFFVISGFLITGLVLREVEETGRLSLRRFYARRAKRLLPATAVVFLAVTALTILALPVTRWREIAGDLVASATYLVNWRLADRSVDYLAEGAAAGPLQHLWSLAVEEQFYLLWPLLVVALVRPRAGSPARRLGWGLLLVAAASLAWSVHLTARDPGAAYFVTTTRLWELALGALLAVVVARGVIGRSPRARQALGWTGLAAIGYAAVTFDATTAFPGTAALVPTLGAAAVLVAGSGDPRGELAPLTGPFVQRVGALSYSLYLWHWPLVVVATSLWAGPDGVLPLATALAVVAGSALPAWLTYRFVEEPFHRSRRLAAPWRAAVTGAACVAVGFAGAAALTLAADRADVPAERGATGAAALGDEPAAVEPTYEVTSLTPSLLDAADDVAAVYADGCHQDALSPGVLTCVYGDADSDVVVALVGDSHAAHWQPALAVLAEEHGFRLETSTKSSCLLAPALVWEDSTSRPYTSCLEWQATLTERLMAEPPDVVVVSAGGHYQLVEDGAALSREESREPVAQAMAATWQALEEEGIEVLALLDTPWPGIDAPECVSEHLTDLSGCAVPRAEAMERSGAAILRAAAERVPAADLLDLTEFVCPREECLPVVGGVLTHSDTHHLTATYARTLAPRIAGPLTSLLG